MKSFLNSKKSDDERIRKDIIWCLKHSGISPDRPISPYVNTIIKDAIAWLEKQGEQTSTDKVEPKFHEGDFAVSNLDGKTRRISEVHYDEYNSYYVVDGNSVNLKEYDRLHHIWSIADAKDGDVLSYRDGQWIFIYEKMISEDTLKYYVLLSEKGSTVNDAAFSLLTSCITPATKEQRDNLFAAIKEAGCEWDAEKKELNEIKQK